MIAFPSSMRGALLFLSLTASAWAQSISLGAKGGLNLQPTLEGRTVDNLGILGRCSECASAHTLPYLVGPSLEIQFSRKLSVSVDALYGRSVYTHTSTTFATPTFAFFNEEKHSVDRIEIPILLRYTHNWSRVQPFIAAGMTVRNLKDVLQSTQNGSFDANGNPPFVFIGASQQSTGTMADSSTTLGPTFAVGAQFGSYRLRPSIEYRYTRWTSRPIAVGPLNSFAPVIGSPTLASEQNQSQLIAGLMFDFAGAGSATKTGKVSPSIPGRSIFSRISIGVRAGIPLTQAFEAKPAGDFAQNPFFNKCAECGTQRTVPYIVGPTIEARIAGPFRASIDALYSRADFNQTSSTFSASGTSSLQDTKTAIDRWDFPVLLKSDIGRSKFFQPFVGIGTTVQYNRASVAQMLVGSHNLFGGTSVLRSNVLGPAAEEVVAGPTASVGGRLGQGRRSISLEFRYTRWFESAIARASFGSTPLVNGPVTIRSTQNQAQILIGIVF